MYTSITTRNALKPSDSIHFSHADRHSRRLVNTSHIIPSNEQVGLTPGVWQSRLVGRRQ